VSQPCYAAKYRVYSDSTRAEIRQKYLLPIQPTSNWLWYSGRSLQVAGHLMSLKDFSSDHMQTKLCGRFELNEPCEGILLEADFE
jgi:hypothetical protein